MAGFRGVYPAIITPMTADGQLNEAAYREVMEFNIQAGVHGFWVAGGTGESVLLDDEENMRIADIVADQSRGRIENIMHVGAATTARATKLAEHAAKAGVEAICCVPPFFYRQSDDAIVEHYRAVGAAADLPLMGEKWPATWLDAAQVIRALPDDRISADKFAETLTEHGVTGSAQGVLARWLHELGDILYFADDPELADTVVLSPEWVTENISRVLECKDIIEGLGIFRREHMADVWSNLEETTRDQFLRLMERFDLSYRIPDDRENKSLVVERLSLDPPEYEKRWNAILETDGCKEISMKFDLQIARPAGIPTWFIARSHRFTTDTHWRYGALFSDPPDRRHLALAVGPPSERYMKLTVRGPSPVVPAIVSTLG